MNSKKKQDLELITELESVYQKVYEKESQLKEHGHREGNGTDRYQTMSDVRESETRYRRLFESAQDGILILDGDSGAITDANPYIIESLGYSLQDLKGKRLWEIGAFSDWSDNKAAFEELQRKEYIRYNDLPLKTKDGQSRQVEFVSNVYLVNGKKIIQCNIRDITERKHAEESLRESQSNLSEAMKIAKICIWEYDVARDQFTFNDQFYELLCTTVEQEDGYVMSSRTYAQKFVYPEDMPLVGLEIQKALQTNDPEYHSQLDHRIICADGEIRYINVHIRIEKDAQGRTVKTHGVNQDITERKEAENALRESNLKFHQLADNITDAFWIRSPDMREVHYISPAFERIWGRSVESLYANPKQWEDFIFVDDRERVLEQFALLVGDVTNLDIEYRIVRPDGEIRWIRVRGFQVRDVAEKLIRHIGIVTDITERKQTQATMIRERNFADSMLSSLPGLFYLVDEEGNFLRWNTNLEKKSGYSSAEIADLNPLDLFHGKEKLYIAGQLRRVFETGEAHAEAHLVSKSGAKTPYHFSGVRILFNDKLAYIGVGTDITERKRTEISLGETSALFEALLQNTTDGIYFKDMQSRFVHFSRQMLEVFHLTHPGELKGRTDFDFFSEDYARSAYEIEQEIISTGKPIFNLEEKETHLDGRVNWVLTSKMQWCDRGGGVLGTMGISRDITDRKRSEMHLQESEERYRRLVEFSPNAIMVHSIGKFMYVNPAAVKLLGARDASELLGTSVFDIVHPDYKVSARFRDATSVFENNPLPFTEEKFIRIDGVTIDVEIAARPIEYYGVSAVQYVVRDITEHKILQQRLLQSQKNESIGTLAGGIAHDFNNILAIILGYTAIIERRTLTAQKLAEGIAAIKQAVKRGAALVRQILTFARKTDVSFEPINLEVLVDEIVSMLEQTFPEIITFEKIFPNDIPSILADRSQIHQALLNLCVNARDAMPNGGSIFIKAETHTGEQTKEQFPAADKEKYLCISVADTGEGMNETTRRRVFDPFFTTKPLGKGTGLGLSVVYGVVQAHHGFISVESELGKGTSFLLYFPIPKTGVKAADSRQTKTFETGGMETILVVEDEDLLLEIVRSLLESKGYTVIVAHDGAEAVEVYKTRKTEIALVITDLGLPVMTGMEEFKKLKEIDSDVKVIFASGFFDSNVKSELLKAGGKGFLQKPYMSDEILRTIRKTLDQKK